MKRSTIIRSFFVATLGLALAAGALSVTAHEDHDKHKDEATKEVTLVGEVLDLYCYMKHPADGQGLEHAKCAKSCINKGLPIGFLADGEVYIIIGKEHESAADIVVEFAGVQSKLTGVVIEHGGIKSIELHSIEKVES